MMSIKFLELKKYIWGKLALSLQYSMKILRAKYPSLILYIPVPPTTLYFFFLDPSKPGLPRLLNDLDVVLFPVFVLTLIPAFLSLTCLARAAILVFLLATLALIVEETVSFRSALNIKKTQESQPIN